MSRRNVLVTLGACAVLTTSLAAVLIPTLRVELHAAVLTPLIAAFYTIRAYIERLPQLLLWVVPILIASVMLFRLLFALPRSNPAHGRERQPRAGDGKLAETIRRIERTRVSRFARVRVCLQLSESAMRLLARRRGIPLAEARRRLRSGDWEAEPCVVNFLTPHLHHRRPAGAGGFLVQLANALTFLERYRQEI